jgi:hypothetical protein
MSEGGRPEVGPGGDGNRVHIACANNVYGPTQPRVIRPGPYGLVIHCG